MSEGQAQSRGELIVQRDELIEQLQGEWAVGRNVGGLIRRAFVSASSTLFVFSILWMMMLIMIFSRDFEAGPGKYGLSNALWVFFAIGLGVAGLILSTIGFVFMYIRRCRPSIQVEGVEFSQDERLGVHARKLNLHDCYLQRYFDTQNSQDLEWGVFENSEGMNEFEIEPELYENGDQLFELLCKLSHINHAIKKHDQLI